MLKGKKQYITVANLIIVIGTIVTIATFLGLLTSFYEYSEDFFNFEPKSNLDANIITEPPNKITKASDVIFEFNICNIGKTGEQYNYSLELKKFYLKYESELQGTATLNDGEPCEEFKYIIRPETKYTSAITYPEISFSINVYSTSKNKLLLSENYKYIENEENIYELEI